MKETTRHIILAAKERYDKQGGIKAVVSKITGVEEKYLDKQAITYWCKNACYDIGVSKEDIIDSIIKKTQSFRKYEDSQDIIIEALKNQLTLLNVLDEDNNIILKLGETDLFDDESIEILGFPPKLNPMLIDNDSKSDIEYIIPLLFTDRKNDFVEKNGDFPVLKVDFICDSIKINNLRIFVETSERYINLKGILNHKDNLKILNYIKNNLKIIQRLFKQSTDKTIPITKKNIEFVIEKLKGDNNDN